MSYLTNIVPYYPKVPDNLEDRNAHEWRQHCIAVRDLLKHFFKKKKHILVNNHVTMTYRKFLSTFTFLFKMLVLFSLSFSVQAGFPEEISEFFSQIKAAGLANQSRRTRKSVLFG